MSLRTSGDVGKEGRHDDVLELLARARSPTPGSNARCGSDAPYQKAKGRPFGCELRGTPRSWRRSRCSGCARAGGVELEIGPGRAGGVALPAADLPVARSPELAGGADHVARRLQGVGPDRVLPGERRRVGPRVLDHPAVSSGEKRGPGRRAPRGGGEGLGEQCAFPGDPVEGRGGRRPRTRRPRRATHDWSSLMANEDVGSRVGGGRGGGRQEAAPPAGPAEPSKRPLVPAWARGLASSSSSRAA